MDICGGLSEVKAADERIQKLCDEAKQQILQKLGKESFDIFEALTYQTQMVAGKNYFIKIKVSAGGECIHVILFEPLPVNNEPLSVTSVQVDKKVADPI